MSRNYDQFQIGGKLTRGSSVEIHSVINPYTGELISEFNLASEEQIEAALNFAQVQFDKTPPSLSQRHEVINQLINAIDLHNQLFMYLIISESGKPVSYAESELKRSVRTLELSLGALEKMARQEIDVDYDAGKGKKGYVQRFPIGPVLAITPFNFPLNLVLHKVGPAIAAGCPIILKPAPQTPLTALLLAKIVSEIEVLKDMMQVVLCSNNLAQKMVEDNRVAVLSFTGSDKVGWKLKQLFQGRTVALELGGDAAVIIDKNLNIDQAVQDLIPGCFLYAGQICISTQRVFIHEHIATEFIEKFLDAVKQVKSGDPQNKDVVNGPMIDKANLDRINEWVHQALESGAELLIGGEILDEAHNLYAPTVIRSCPSSAKINSNEAFAPVVLIEEFADFTDAIRRVNNSRFGLQVGVYTESKENLELAFNEIQVGGVIHDYVPGFRVDGMPYGGVKDSGIGREGPQYALEHLTELKVLITS